MNKLIYSSQNWPIIWKMAFVISEFWDYNSELFRYSCLSIVLLGQILNSTLTAVEIIFLKFSKCCGKNEKKYSHILRSFFVPSRSIGPTGKPHSTFKIWISKHIDGSIWYFDISKKGLIFQYLNIQLSHKNIKYLSK